MVKNILYVLIIFIGIIGIVATVIAIPVSTGISVGTLLPGGAGVVLIAYGLVRLLRPGYIIQNVPIRIAVTVIVCVGILSFVVIEMLILIGANTDVQDKDANFVVVLGCGVFSDGRLTLTLKNRLDVAYEYLVVHEDSVCIVSGAQGDNEPMPEAEAMGDYLVSLGIDTGRIALEPHSYSTKDNMVMSAEIMQNQYSEKPMSVAVVTSDFHVFRSLILATNSGMDAFGIACPTPWRVRINCYMREYLAVINSLLFQMD